MSEEKTESKQKRNPYYTAARVLAAFLFHTFYPMRVYGRENLSLTAPYMVICNHGCVLDPLAIGSVLKQDEVIFVAKKELTKNKLMNFLIVHLKAIPIDRHHSDMSAMRQCIQTLRKGQVLGIFPEGTRHHHGVMTEIESGTAMIALRGNARIQPIYIKDKLRPFRMNHLYIGHPFELAELAADGINTEACEKALEKIKDVYKSELIPMGEIKQK